MSPERWRRIDQMLEAARNRRSEERAAFQTVARQPSIELSGVLVELGSLL